MKNKFKYQDDIAKEVVESLSFNYKAIVLASAPNSGKTTISQKICNLLPENSKILVVTHGQNLLKNQYLSELSNSKININFSYGVLNSNSKVEVCLMQEYSKIEKTYDVVIIDEGHQFYGSKMCNELLKNARPKNLLILTGTPSKFTKENSINKNSYKIIYLSVQELERKDIYAKVVTDFVKTNSDDINHEMLSLKTKINKYKNQKIMIACPSIAYAEKVKESLSYRKVGISTAKDSKNAIIDKYLNNELDTLIVVNKGVLGFNDPKTTMVIDMKSSSNLETTYQLMARVLRKDGDVEKTYLRLCNVNEMKEQMKFMNNLKMLFTKKVFNSYKEARI